MVNTLKEFLLIKAHREGKWWIHLGTSTDHHKIRLPDEFLVAIRDLITDGLENKDGYRKSISLGNYQYKDTTVDIEVVEEKEEEELPEFPE